MVDPLLTNNRDGIQTIKGWVGLMGTRKFFVNGKYSIFNGQYSILNRKTPII
jgi:hypothetical protein